MRWQLRRPAFIVGIFVVLVVAAGAFLLPLAVSSDLVRDRLERELGNWAGHPISLGDAPELSFWPLPTIQLSNVEISPSVYADGDPIMRADSIIANFNLFSAVLGAPSFSEFKLIRPTFTLEIYPDRTSNWTTREGALLEGIQAAIALDTSQQAAGEKSQDIVIPESAALGNVTIVDGTLKWIRDPGAPAEKLTAVNGTISWTEPTAMAHAELSAILRGEQIRLDISSAAPLLLLGQRTSQVQVNISSSPLNLNFSGQVDLSPKGFANGSLSLKSPSVRRALEWSGTEIKPGEAIGALELTADLSTGTRTVRLDNLIIVVDENRGIGVLDVAIPADAPPRIAGTLAFNSLDITSFLQAFTPLPQSGKEIASTIDTRFLREIGLDLRLSSQSAKFGPVGMTNLAASARVAQGRATFDVSDATAYGGNLTGRIALLEEGVDGGAKLQLSARNTNLGEMFDALGLTGPLPRGVGTLDLQLTTPYPTWATAMSDLNGKFSLSLGPGTTPGVNLEKFRQLASSERFFQLSETATGEPFEFQSARFEAVITGGRAELTLGEIVGATSVISLSGVVPYLRGGLAVAGMIAPKPPTGEEAASEKTTATGTEPTGIEPLRFFVGGTWPQPVISPVSD